MTETTLRTALADYSFTKPLKSGAQTIPGVKLAFEEVKPVNRAFAPMAREQKFDVSHITQLLHARRERLAPLLKHPLNRRVVLHVHSGFHEVDCYSLIADLLRMIPGLDVVVADFQAPGHMCSAISTVPAALKDVQRKSVAFCAQHQSDTLVTGFHACQRLLCGLKTTDGLNVVNYVNLLIESMGKTPLPDEYSEWKNAGSPNAIRAKIGSERLAKIGVDFFEQQMLPELRKMPEK